MYFQAVDASGRAVQSMRSVTYLQPGERRGCVGCHEPSGTTPAVRSALAARRGPSPITPGPDGTRPFCYTRLVQPVLDRHCVRCHDGTEKGDKSNLPRSGPTTLRAVPGASHKLDLSPFSAPVLTGEPLDTFTRSYESLRPFVRWYEWTGNSIGYVITRPGQCGADASRLCKILDDPTHAGQVKLTDAERRRLYVWLDGNAPFYGVYGEEALHAQQRGQTVPVPEVQ